MKKHIVSFRPAFLFGASLLAIALLMPSSAQAQCEVGAMGSAQGTQATIQSSVQSTTQSIKQSMTSDLDTAENSVLDALDKMGQEIIGKLDWWWNKLGQDKDANGQVDNDAKPALQSMTKELNAGVVDQSRQRLSDADASNVLNAARRQQQMEYDTVKKYIPTNQACQFDSFAGYLGRSVGVSRAMSTGYSLDFNRIGQATKGSPAAGGPATLQKSRWDTYRSKFCDPDDNGGHAGCNAAAEAPNADILPGKTLFIADTIDIENPTTRESVNQLMFNITGYDTPELISQTALRSPAGLAQRQENREYLAQMDAVGSLVYGIAAERTPGKKAPVIEAMRKRVGIVDASTNPSKREIRQAIVEQLWDPQYYIELNDGRGTLTQKEIYLKAYSLVMLNDLIAKQERISTAYAIETANMLRKQTGGRTGAISGAALK